MRGKCMHAFVHVTKQGWEVSCVLSLEVHYDNTYKDFTYNNLTYNINKCDIP
jgi:hypothetical protein